MTALEYANDGGERGIVYTGVAGGALANAGRSAIDSIDPAFSAQAISGDLVDGGIYHLTRISTDFPIFLPAVIR